MRIPPSTITIKDVSLQNNRLAASTQAPASDQDVVSLANIELKANELLVADLRRLDNSSKDLDPREGHIRVRDYQNPACGPIPFTEVTLQGDNLLAKGIGRSGVEMECRKSNGSKICVQSDYGLPGAVPGLQFSTYPQGVQADAKVNIWGGYSKPEMVLRMSKDNLLQVAAQLPDNSQIDKSNLTRVLKKAKAQDFQAIEHELLQDAKNNCQTGIELASKGTAYCGLVGLASLAAAQANQLGLAVGIFLGGLGAGYAALKVFDHRFQQQMKGYSDLSSLQSHLINQATEFPQSFLQPSAP